ncbi:MAG TPA: AMP-binding protein [Bryobacteraceae bacterium]|nr:AMP-binding protein [Bryobacteraceae bacterium]
MGAIHQNVTNYLLEGKSPSRPALFFLDGQFTYGQLSDVCDGIVAQLLSGSAQAGDRVILIAENSLFWIGSYLAVLRAGLICVPLPPGIPAPELRDVLVSTRPRFGFVQERVLARHSHILSPLRLATDRGSPNSLGALGAASADPGSFGAIPAAGGDDLAALMFTSGSTGTPRGVMVSHRNIIANTESIIQYLHLTGDDRMMTVLPFHYCFGTSLLHTHLRTGGSLVVDSRFMYPEDLLGRMVETECTGFAGVPSHFHLLMGSSGLRRRSFPRLRYMQQAGGRLPETSLRELRAILPDTKIFVMYGQTEATARLSYLPPEYLESKMGSIGRGIPGVTLRVLNQNGQPVRPGEVGEITADGENISRGYWGAPEETAASFRGGMLCTGDLATVDEDGFIYILDRARDFLKCGGKRVSCRQIEDRILQCRDLAEAAVIGIADDVTGEAVKAFVVPCGAVPPDFGESLRVFCRKNLPLELVPKEIVVLDALPKNSAGKVSKRELRSMGLPLADA